MSDFIDINNADVQTCINNLISKHEPVYDDLIGQYMELVVKESWDDNTLITLKQNIQKLHEFFKQFAPQPNNNMLSRLYKSSNSSQQTTTNEPPCKNLYTAIINYLAKINTRYTVAHTVREQSKQNPGKFFSDNIDPTPDFFTNYLTIKFEDFVKIAIFNYNGIETTPNESFLMVRTANFNAKSDSNVTNPESSGGKKRTRKYKKHTRKSKKSRKTTNKRRRRT